MSGFAIAHLDEIDELSDGRQPWRPVRHHFGISSFGITAWTGHEAGDRILNEHDEADQSDRAEELTESGQRYAVPLYNLACCESLAGRTDEALEHLGQAIELMDGMREYAKGDSDLDAIRGEPRFEELVGG
jgi:hypothetical protein